MGKSWECGWGNIVLQSFVRVPVAAIQESKSNPRKDFQGIDELAASIKERGIVQPLIIRKSERVTHGEPHTFDLVCGARRLRAAIKAGLLDVPAIITECTDQAALELQLIENSQRLDVHPMEEAEAYESLLALNSDTAYEPVSFLARKTGKGKIHIQRRLLLLGLPAEARKAYHDRLIPLDTALVIARIPNEKVRALASKKILAGDYDSHGPLEPRAAARLVQEEFMLRLEEAPFDRAAATLLPEIGACGPCPKRTGNAQDLFGDVKGKDVCTDAACFKLKTSADWDKKATAAKAEGKVVLAESAGKKIFPHGDEYISNDSGYVRADGEITSNYKSIKIAKIPGSKELQITLCRAPNSGAAVALYKREDVDRLLRSATAKKASKNVREPSVIAEDRKHRESVAREKAKRELAKKVGEKLLAAAGKNIQAGKAKELALLRLLASETYNSNDEAKQLGFKSDKDIIARGKAADLLAFLFLSLIGDAYIEDLKELAKIGEACGVDVKKLIAEVQDSQNQEAKPTTKKR